MRQATKVIDLKFKPELSRMNGLGLKTMTRRVLKPHPPDECIEILPCPGGDVWKGYRKESPLNLSCTDYIESPYRVADTFTDAGADYVITAVRVERLQDISYRDCLAEGLRHHMTDEIQTDNAHMNEVKDIFAASIWDSIYRDNPEKCWDSNPWVWIVEYKRKEAGDEART